MCLLGEPVPVRIVLRAATAVWLLLGARSLSEKLLLLFGCLVVIVFLVAVLHDRLRDGAARVGPQGELLKISFQLQLLLKFTVPLVHRVGALLLLKAFEEHWVFLSDFLLVFAASIVVQARHYWSSGFERSDSLLWGSRHDTCHLFKQNFVLSFNFRVFPLDNMVSIPGDLDARRRSLRLSPNSRLDSPESVHVNFVVLLLPPTLEQFAAR